MTEITYIPEEYTLTSQGHAGYAGKGQDIVCASISALTMGAGHGLYANGIPCHVWDDEDETKVEIRATPRPGQEHDAMKILDAFAAALEALAEVYPYNAHITVRHGNVNGNGNGKREEEK